MFFRIHKISLELLKTAVGALTHTEFRANPTFETDLKC